MKNLFFGQVKIFILIIFMYVLVYKTVFSCLLTQESGFQNVYAIILTAIIMTTFELGFIWVNYYFAFNNSGRKIINNSSNNISSDIKRKNPNTYKTHANGFGFLQICCTDLLV